AAPPGRRRRMGRVGERRCGRGRRRRPGPGPGAAGAAAVHVASALARPARREWVLPRLLEPIPLATLPFEAGADAAPRTALGAVPSRQPALRGRGPGRNAREPGGRLVPRLPPRAGAAARA